MENINPSATPPPQRANKSTAVPTSSLPPTPINWGQRWREVAEWICAITPSPDLNSSNSSTAKQLDLIFRALEKAWKANNPTSFQGAFRRLQHLFPRTSSPSESSALSQPDHNPPQATRRQTPPTATPPPAHKSPPHKKNL